MWLNREQENRVIFLLFSRNLRKWLELLFALLVIHILAHTCWVRTFSFLSRERTVHYTIVLIPTVFLLYALVSNCYLVMIFFIRIICEQFEFTLHSHSWSFANIIVFFRLGSIHVVFLSYHYRERTELKWKMYMIRPFPNNNWCEFQNFHIRSHSAVDSAQWDWALNRYGICLNTTNYQIYQYAWFHHILAVVHIHFWPFWSGGIPTVSVFPVCFYQGQCLDIDTKSLNQNQ